VTDARRDSPSLVERIRPVAAGAPVVATHFLEDIAVFALGEEALLLVAPEGEPRRVAVHDGAILCAASDGARVVTGGDDGKVVATGARGAPSVVATDSKRRWIDRVAAGRDAVAWSAGKQVFVRTGKGELRTLEAPSTPGGLAFAPKGLRLAVAHYNGATLWFPNAQVAPERLEWKGSHLGITFSPDGRFLVTAMQEPTLHGWRVADGHHMRMSGYTQKVRAMDWSADGKSLATSGADKLVVWPFQAKDGPMGKAPLALAPAQHPVTAVACHPKDAVVAAGYEDGMVLLVRLPDGAEVLAKPPGGGAVAALAWNSAGKLLAFGTEEGEAGVLAL
jgi:WD40 repeat protein